MYEVCNPASMNDDKSIRIGSNAINTTPQIDLKSPSQLVASRQIGLGCYWFSFANENRRLLPAVP